MAPDSSRDDSAWSISVKTVGSEHKGDEDGGVPDNDFTVNVSPNDDLTALYDQIEGVTGLQASQQRLIYRGRLIGHHDTSQEQKIKDIKGLSSGQTIHLVKKRERTEAESTTEDGNANLSRAASNASEESNDGLSGTGTSSLLAALLGLSSEDEEESARGGSNRSLRGSRFGGRRRSQHRLTQEDLQVPDPGSMESVRQGLMTLHTLLPPARTAANTDERYSPLDSNRQWYRGQWIDCRDTVNQWLEATIVDIVHPDDLLPSRAVDTPRRQSTSPPTLQPVSDPFVHAGDYDGRIRLLLEPCEEGDPGDLGGHLSGYRRRDTNESVQLLFIHYNGWPHRWDEWIRSDSERIRPFRTRTRHPDNSSHASPMPQSVFSESPPTFIHGEDEARDRQALLPELSRAVTLVNAMLSTAASRVPPAAASTQTELPWDSRTTSDGEEELEDLPPVEGRGSNIVVARDESASERQRQSSCLSRRELEALAPLLDRLGRTLIDAAPHLAHLAASVTEENTEAEESHQLESIEEHPSTLGGLLSLLSRDRRRQSTASNNVVVPSDNMTTGEQTNGTSEDGSSIDPDYVDFATGVVNTTRGEVRSGPRRSASQNSDDLSGLLGAYLAAASLGGLVNAENTENGDENGGSTQGLGRLLRERGNGSGGIDIHIHAVVTAPGMLMGGGGGGIGLATLGGPPTPTGTAAGDVYSSSGSSRRAGSNLLRMRPANVIQEDDDQGIFSDLYSENPDPVNPNRPDASQPSGDSRTNSGRSQELSRMVNRLSTRSSSFSLHSSRTPRARGTARRSIGRRSMSNRERQRPGIFGRFFRRSND